MFYRADPFTEMKRQAVPAKGWEDSLNSGCAQAISGLGCKTAHLSDLELNIICGKISLIQNTVWIKECWEYCIVSWRNGKSLTWNGMAFD